MKRTVFVLLLAILSGELLSAQNLDSTPSRKVMVDWEKMVLSITLHSNGVASRNQAELMTRMERQLMAQFPDVLPQCLAGLQVDSQSTLFDLLSGPARRKFDNDEASSRAMIVATRPASTLEIPRSSESGANLDLKQQSGLNMTWELPLFPLIPEQIVEFRNPKNLQSVLSWKANTAYTGLIIYAEETLPWYGTDQKAEIQPCVFPAIRDQASRVVLDISQIYPSMIQKWGVAAYFVSQDDPGIRKRVGDHPLIVAARGLYGESPCDPMISQDEADTLLYNAQSRNALQEGRVVIIISSGKKTQQVLTQDQ